MRTHEGCDHANGICPVQLGEEAASEGVTFEQIAAFAKVRHDALAALDRKCFCPDDCNCHHPWRTNFCGCRQH